jgi:hypothetical protein
MKSLRLACMLTILLSTSVLAQSNRGLPQPDPAARGKIVQSYGKLPLTFEANQGQTDARVKFLSRGSGYTLFLTGDEAVFSLRGSEARPSASTVGDRLNTKAVVTKTGAVLQMKLRNANRAAKVTSTDQLPGRSNYFIGNDPKKWRSNVPTYAKVKYEEIYSGIDLVYYGNQRQLEYDFVVAPGADLHRIQFGVRGAKSISRDEHGDLVLHMTEGEIRWRKPVVYQEKDGTRQDIDGQYIIKRGQRVSFEVAEYDSKRPLIIDPALAYSTYLGGGGYDIGYGIAVDSSGNAYVTGATYATNFPTMNPLQPANGGRYDAFVSEFNPAGSTLVYSTYLGGSDSDYGYGIAVDSSGSAYVTGSTQSADFPTTPGAFQTTCGGGCPPGNPDAFVAKLNSTGSALVYSTYLGGSVIDNGRGIAVDKSGNAHITGLTSSADFPVTPGAFQATCGGICYFSDAFVTTLNPTGSALVYSTYLGGSSVDYGYGIAVDTSGDAYVTGFTSSTDFPTMNPLQPANGGGSDAFVAQLNSTGSALVYSTYLGGNGADEGWGIAVDTSGDAYVTGSTGAANFPVTPGAFQTTCGGGNNCGSSPDAFVAHLNPTGSALVYSTYLGGSGADVGYGIAVDSSGDAYVTGYTSSTDFPTMNPLQPYGGNGDAFVAQLNSTGSALVYSTYLGGSQQDFGQGVAVDSSGDAYVTGYTSSTDFPTTPGAFQTRCAGGCGAGNGDAFVTKVSLAPVVTLSPSSLKFGNQNVGTTSTPQNIMLTNSGELPLSISGIVATGDFAQNNTCPVGESLAAGSNCMISVTFTPTAEGTRNGSVMITDNAANSPQSAPLTGVGITPVVKLFPTSLDFGNQTVDITSSPKTSTLTNTGNGALTVNSINVTGANYLDFSEANNCGTSVPVGGSCQITVTFTPSGTGNESASVSITDNAPNSPQSLPLRGHGVLPAVTFSPTNLTFPTQVVFTTSPAQKVTLTNTGLGILKITKGGLSGQFVVTTNCGGTVAAGASCTINVTFKPKAKGTQTGDVSVTDNAPGSPQKLPSTGTGTYVQLSPASVNFGNQPINTTSNPKYITLTNKGSGAVNFTGSGITITGTDEGDFAQTNNCGSSVASGGSCKIKVTFTPLAQGQRTADVSISDDGGGSPQTVPLMGTGTP